MSKDSRIIVPGRGPIIPLTRQDRRASLAEMNQLFAERIKYLEDLNGRQAASIKAMNKFLTQLALICGTPVPASQTDGANAADELLARMKVLVEKEEHAAQNSMERSE